MKFCERLHVLCYKYKQFFNVVIYANLQLQQYVMQHIELCPKYAAESRSFNDFNFLPVLGALSAADLIRAFQGLSRWNTLFGKYGIISDQLYSERGLTYRDSYAEIYCRLVHLECILASFRDGGGKVSVISFI